MLSPGSELLLGAQTGRSMDALTRASAKTLSECGRGGEADGSEGLFVEHPRKVGPRLPREPKARQEPHHGSLAQPFGVVSDLEPSLTGWMPTRHLGSISVPGWQP